jgi:membrane-associated phospholipid phosphatase
LGINVTSFLTGLDISIYRALNDFIGWSPILDRIVIHAYGLGGPFFMGIVGLLWFWPDKDAPRRRETILILILVVALSLVLNRVLSTCLPFRSRPIYSLGANSPTVLWRTDLENWSSFPSDHATYFFAIAASFWFISRWSGLFFGLFAAFDAVARVMLGVHYPSDIIVGALIGIATSVAINRESVRKLIARPTLELEPRYPAYFYGLFFMTLAELSGGLPNTRHFGVAIVHLFTPYSTMGK